MTESLKNAYDETNYESQPITATHPDHLSTLGYLLGLDAPSAETARVLELGCATGANLLSMAATLPKAHFIGIDISPQQIAQGHALAKRAGISNVQLQVGSILDISEKLGAFDFIITHGIFSWVPKEVQKKILQVSKQNLAPSGIAYVSYNTFPGWRIRGIVRDMMLLAGHGATTTKARVDQARRTLQFMHAHIAERPLSGPGTDAAEIQLRSYIRKEIEQVMNMPDWYLLHDLIAEYNDPMYFSDFARLSAEYGLHYLSDAEVSKIFALEIQPGTQQALQASGLDLIGREQHTDFMRNRMFRRSLLCATPPPVERKVHVNRISNCYVYSALKPVNARLSLANGVREDFKHPDGGAIFSPSAILKAAVWALSQVYPSGLHFNDLVAKCLELLASQLQNAEDSAELRNTLCADLGRCYCADLVQLRRRPPHFSNQIGTSPCVSPLARAQALTGEKVATLRHDSFQLTPRTREFLQLFDGVRSLDTIKSSFREKALGSLFTQRGEAEFTALLDQALAEARNNCLLM